ncbi:MAG: RDD family protein [Thermodesulfobacteriota bacterium]
MSDSEKQKEQIKARYQGMSTEDLVELWKGSGNDLSQEAAMLLGAELASRGVSLESLPEPPVAVEKRQRDPNVRPWVRFWARILDYILLGWVVGMLLGLRGPDRLVHQMAALPWSNPVLSGLLVVFIWLFVETLLLATWGYTPGKWLFKVRVRAGDGSKLRLYDAFRRSVHVWGRGMGLGLPFVSLVANIIAYFKLTKKGITSWDARCGCMVSHQIIGAGRVAVAVGFFVLVFALAGAMR